MHNLLSWQISDTAKIMLSSADAHLGSVTCCDAFNLSLWLSSTQHALCDDISSSQLIEVKKMLQQIITQNIQVGNIAKIVFFGRDECGQVLVEIRQNLKPFYYGVVSLEVLQSWVAQIDLLQVVMQENENEKKARGSGCCG